jgi:tripartite-type tricarboxylate transporter receptor subunit TctC
MFKYSTKTLGALSAVTIAAGALLSPAVASAVDFKGKTIEAIVAFKEGGGGTFYTRLYAPFFQKYLPGKPTIIVRNIPGGGGIKGSNWFQANAKPDGLSYSVASTSNYSSMVLGGKKVKYSLFEWQYIMLEPTGTVFYTRPETGVKGKNVRDDVTAFRNIQVIAGAKSPTSSELHAFLVFDLLGIKNVKPVFGLSSGGQRKAILRGEVNFKRDSTLNYLTKVEKYVKKGTLVPWLTLGYWDNGKVVRDPAFPNLPTVVEAYKAVNGGKEPSGTAWNSYLPFFHMAVSTSKGFALPPKTPQAVVDAYITAAKKIQKDKDFAKKAGKMYGVYPILYGKDANGIVRAATELTPQAREHITKFIKEKFGVNI